LISLAGGEREILVKQGGGEGGDRDANERNWDLMEDNQDGRTSGIILIASDKNNKNINQKPRTMKRRKRNKLFPNVKDKYREDVPITNTNANTNVNTTADSADPTTAGTSLRWQLEVLRDADSPQLKELRTLCVAVLHDFLRNTLSDSENNFGVEESLKEFLQFEDCDLEDNADFLTYFPDGLQLRHSVNAYEVLANRKGNAIK
jgi:hypothetical protein